MLGQRQAQRAAGHRAACQLSDDVKQEAHERHFADDEEAERDGRVQVPTTEAVSIQSVTGEQCSEAVGRTRQRWARRSKRRR